MLSPANLWQWEGRVNRATYAIVGAVAFALKLAVDRFLIVSVFHEPWSLLFYWRPFGAIRGIAYLQGKERGLGLLLLLVALPFVWLGVAMTVKRLRDAAHPLWLVCLFFVPLLNFIFFAALCLLPSVKQTRIAEAPPWPAVRPLDRWIPRSPLGSAVLATGVTTVLGLALTLLSTQVLKSYGFGLFVALPFCLGLFAVLVHSYHGPRTMSQCLGVSLLPLAILAVMLLAVAVEGFICILMAAPLAAALAVLGGALGYAIQSAHWGRSRTPAMLSAVVFFLPAFAGAEKLVQPQAEVFVVKSAVEVNAPPPKVWEEVIAFSEIEPPKELVFRAGVAYPVRAEMTGRGPGAVRRCMFSTGPFVEPIKVWDEPRLLRFGVTENPAPMQELTPYGHIEPAHLHGYFESHQGQFLLTVLPGGRTRLEGTTWYSHTIWPAAY